MEATRELIGLVERATRREHRTSHGRGGAAVVLHPVNADLSLNLHFHLLVLNGIYVPDSHRGERFLALQTEPNPRGLRKVADRLRQRLEQLVPAQPHRDQINSALPPASIARIGGAAPKRPPTESRVLAAKSSGLSVHGSPPIQERQALARVAAYISRPLLHPAAVERPTPSVVQLRLQRPAADGTTHLEFETMEFERRLHALARTGQPHSVTYHGALANGRSQPEPQLSLFGTELPRSPTPSREAGCRACGGKLSVMAIEPLSG